ncbi:MAG: hypothetical protein MJ191_07150 [Clostridium sp.]|nr:hypothetical protein [Clostridium sp.]
MAKYNSKNNDLLRDSKRNTTPKIYSLLCDLVNDEREDLAELVLKIDYLISYASNAAKGKDFKEAKETVYKANERIKMLKAENVDVSHLEYLLEGVEKKIKK